MNPKESRNPTSERTGMPPMMAAMMGASPDFNPAAMCQSMMTAVGKAAEMAAYATPEVRTLFELAPIPWTRGLCCQRTIAQVSLDLVRGPVVVV